MNQFDQMRAAVSEAETILKAADSVASTMASLLVGRLRRVSSGWVLRALKKELANYNMTTGEWK